MSFLPQFSHVLILHALLVLIGLRRLSQAQSLSPFSRIFWAVACAAVPVAGPVLVLIFVRLPEKPGKPLRPSRLEEDHTNGPDGLG